MSRGIALSILRQRLKAEVGDAQETNSFADAEYNLLLAQKQMDFANGYDWPFLEHKWDLAVTSGGRYFNLPTSDIRGVASIINFERPILAERYYNTKYWAMDYLITSRQMNWRNSDLGEPLDPIQRWQLVSNVNESSNPNQVEVWPIPITDQKLRFTGQRVINTLASDTDTADLDDLLLVYFVAAERLMLRGQKNAQYKLAQAQQHLVKLRSSYPTNTEALVLGKKSSYEIDNRRITPLVVVH